MTKRARLDAELVRRGLARSRVQAADLIAAGHVLVSGQAAAKAATQVTQDAAITVQRDDSGPDYVSRGGHKLAGALAAFTDLRVAGRDCLDAGASTGGFTDVLLRAGAAHVVAADVGYGQLAWSLRTDPRVTVLDRVNVRNLQPGQVDPRPEVVTADLSFISLTQVLPALVACATPDADFVLMVKPQFEVGRRKVGSGGVVRDPELRAAAVADRRRLGDADRAWRHGRHREPAEGPVGKRGVLPLAPQRRAAADRGQPCAPPSKRGRNERVGRPEHAARRAHRPAGGPADGQDRRRPALRGRRHGPGAGVRGRRPRLPEHDRAAGLAGRRQRRRDGPGDRRRRDAAEGGRARPPGRRAACSASTSATSGSSPRPSPTCCPTPSTTFWPGTTGSSRG